MGQLSKHQSLHVTKMLNVGKPGAGKTGSLACLAKAGYRLIILDFDNGLDILVHALGKDKAALDRVYFETFTDKLQMISGTARTKDGGGKSTSMIVTVGAATAFTRSMKALTKWEFPIEPGSDETYNLGNIGDWDEKTVVVIDSLGLASEAALRFVRQANQHQFDEFTSKPDYGTAMNKVEGMLQLLFSASVRCNVIVNTHITYLEDPISGILAGEPRALGSKLPPKVGGYFNTIVRTASSGSGQSMKRSINTVSGAGMELKLPVLPGIVPATLPIETGLLTIIEKLQSADWIEKEDGKTA